MLIISVKLYSIGLTSLNTLDLSIAYYVQKVLQSYLASLYPKEEFYRKIQYLKDCYPYNSSSYDFDALYNLE